MLLTKAKEKFLRHLKSLERSAETIRGYRMVLNYLEEYYARKRNGPVYLEEITVDELDDFIYTMGAEKKWQPNSVQKCNYALRSFFGYCFRKRLCAADISQHMETIRGERKERIYLSIEEFQELLVVMDHATIKAVVESMFYSGMRVTECLSLQLEDVDFKGGVFHIRRAKGRVYRQVPIHNRLVPLLKDYLGKHRPAVGPGHFFATERSGKVSAQYVGVKLKEAAEKLGWTKNISPHVLRHSFASNLIKKNANLVHVQKLLGHADLRTTSVYTHARMDELTESVNAL